MRVAIFGLSKTGTTGLYGLVKTAMVRAGHDPVAAFEPRDATAFAAFFDRARPRTRFVTKAMVRPVYFEDAAAIGRFTHRIMTLRDPRDRAVSALLFRALSHPFDNAAALDAFLDLLRRKEADPRSMSFKDLFDQADALGVGVSDWERVWSNVDLQTDVLARHDFFLMRYEAFVQHDYDALEARLGLPLGRGDGENAPWLGHITRSKSSGAWRHWFTAADIAAYRPIFKPYMDRFGYADDWTLAEAPAIPPVGASDYVAREHAARARRFALEGADPAAPDAEPDAAGHLLDRAADGRPGDLFRAGRYLRRLGRDAEAFRHFETGHILGMRRCGKAMGEMLDAGFAPATWRSRDVSRHMRTTAQAPGDA